MSLEGRRQGRAAGTGKKRPCRWRPTRSSRGMSRRGKLASGVGVGQRPPDARGIGGTEPLTQDFAALPAGRRTEQTEREARSPGVRPPAADSNTDGWRARPISSWPWAERTGRQRPMGGRAGGCASGARGTLGEAGVGNLPDLGSPSGRTGDGCRPRRRLELSGSAADVTGLSGKGGPEPLARVSVYPAVKWDQVQHRPQGGA